MSWVNINQDILESSLFKNKNKNPLIVFMYLLLSVNFKKVTTYINSDHKTIMPGSIVTGRKKIARECMISEQQVRTALSFLVESKRISIEPYSSCSIITILDWSYYIGG